MRDLVKKWVDQAKALYRDETGPTIYEYALLLLIGIAVATILWLLRDQIAAVLNRAVKSLQW